jgi:hypothetical protein
VAIIAIEIGVTNTNLVATATTVIAARILEIYALFARNYIIIYRSIPKRNKILKKPDLSLETLADLILNRLLLISVLIQVISNILLVLRVISTITTT